jgi:hypothetical protein
VCAAPVVCRSPLRGLVISSTLKSLERKTITIKACHPERSAAKKIPVSATFQREVEGSLYFFNLNTAARRSLENLLTTYRKHIFRLATTFIDQPLFG